MKDEYKEAFTMLCTAGFFLQESTKYKLPEGAPSKVSQIVGWIDELKNEIMEEQ